MNGLEGSRVLRGGDEEKTGLQPSKANPSEKQEPQSCSVFLEKSIQNRPPGLDATLDNHFDSGDEILRLLDLPCRYSKRKGVQVDALK